MGFGFCTTRYSCTASACRYAHLETHVPAIVRSLTHARLLSPVPLSVSSPTRSQGGGAPVHVRILPFFLVTSWGQGRGDDIQGPRQCVQTELQRKRSASGGGVASSSGAPHGRRSWDHRPREEPKRLEAKQIASLGGQGRWSGSPTRLLKIRDRPHRCRRTSGGARMRLQRTSNSKRRRRYRRLILLP
jgi:hypothetical protein